MPTWPLCSKTAILALIIEVAKEAHKLQKRSSVLKDLSFISAVHWRSSVVICTWKGTLQPSAEMKFASCRDPNFISTACQSSALLCVQKRNFCDGLQKQSSDLQDTSFITAAHMVVVGTCFRTASGALNDLISQGLPVFAWNVWTYRQMYVDWSVWYIRKNGIKLKLWWLHAYFHLFYFIFFKNMKGFAFGFFQGLCFVLFGVLLIFSQFSL